MTPCRSTSRTKARRRPLMGCNLAYVVLLRHVDPIASCLSLQLKCCGNQTYSDWFNIDWSGSGMGNSVPESCCKDTKDCTNTDLPNPPSPDMTIYTDVCPTYVPSLTRQTFPQSINRDAMNWSPVSLGRTSASLVVLLLDSPFSRFV